jgi:hypothetical protein
MEEPKKESSSINDYRKDRISKWQQASVDITNLKFKLSSILDGFTHDERESKKYEELLETVQVLFEHVLEHDKKSDKSTGSNPFISFNYKTGVIFISSAVIYKIIEVILTFML